MNKSNFFSGTSGLLLPVPNKASYPLEFRESSRLGYYSSLFNSIEINSTFRKIPMPRTVQRWTTEVGTDFRFTFKMPESISHISGLQFSTPVLERFIDAIRIADTHAGCILIQFPASLKADHVTPFQQLMELTSNKSGNWKLAVEFRDLSWYQDAVVDIMEQYNATYVIHDFYSMKESPPIPTGSTIYLRFHGPEKGYRGSYNNEFILNLAEKIRDWLNNKLTVYAYFNNTIGDAINNLQMLNSSISSIH